MKKMWWDLGKETTTLLFSLWLFNIYIYIYIYIYKDSELKFEHKQKL